MANWANVARVGNPLESGWQAENLVPVTAGGQEWQVYKPAAQAFQGLLSELASRGYPLQSSGGFNYRNIAGTNKLSQHAFGTAIDVNAAANPQLRGQLKTDMPDDIGALAAKYGLEWGGNWKSKPDPMHFEYRGDGSSSAPGVPPMMPAQQQAPGPTSYMQNILGIGQGGGAQDWMSNTSYSADALLGDLLAGHSPLRRLVYQKISGLFA